MKKLFKEPLVVFLLLGAAMFTVFQQVSDDSRINNSEIVVTAGHIQTLLQGFEKVWQRSPNAKELDGLIQNYIRQEVMYREALVLGLDREDRIIKHRLHQKMAFISEDLVNLDTPEEQELQAYLAAHQEDYRQASRFSFQQIYFNSSKRGQAAEADAMTLLEALQVQAVDVAGLGDPLMLKQHFNNDTEWEIERALGAQFLQALRATPTGRWQGPIASGFGLHLVRIDERIDGTISKLSDVRQSVMRDWALAKRKQTNEAFYESLRKRYRVTVADPESENKSNETATQRSVTGGSQ